MSAQSPDSSSGGSVDASIDAIAKQVRQMQETYAAMRRQIVLFSLAIVVLLVVFGFALVSSARQNLSSDKIGAAAAARAQTMLPKAQEQLIIGLKEAAPTYQKIAFERFQASLPAVEKRINELSLTVPNQINNDLKQHAEGVFTRVSAKLEDDLKREFPKMSHDKLEKLGDKLQVELAIGGEKLRDHLQGLLTKELTRLEATLSGFPIDEYAQMDHDKLSRQLAHNFLMLVDYEIQVSGTPEGLDQSSIVITK